MSGDKPVLNCLASLVGRLVFIPEGRMGVKIAAANLNGPTLMLLRARESGKVGPFAGATYRLRIVAHLRRDSWICMVSLSRGGL